MSGIPIWKITKKRYKLRPLYSVLGYVCLLCPIVPLYISNACEKAIASTDKWHLFLPGGSSDDYSIYLSMASVLGFYE